MIGSFFQTAFADQTLSERAEDILNHVHYHLPSPSIISKREWKELQLDRLVTTLDRTTTSFGRWGLVQLLHPIADEKELLQRKKIITFLLEHEDQMDTFQELLERIHGAEKSLLAYWNKYDQLNKSAEQFYYSVPALVELNKSSLALNVSTAMEMFDSLKYLATTLALGGLSAEFSRWRHSGEEKFDIWRGLSTGLQTPLRQHSFEPHLFKDSGKPPYTGKDYALAFLYGSLGDRYNILREGYTTREKDFWLFKMPSQKISGSAALISFLGASVPTVLFDYQWGSSIVSIGKKIFSMYNTLNQLQARVSDVAQCVQAIKKLRELVIKQAPELATYFDDMYELDAEDFVKQLLSQRFASKEKYFYSRGHVLTMHLEVVQKKEKLIPLFHSVALFDAYCSIARIYKEHQNKSMSFSFPEIVQFQTPLLQYEDAWLPLLSLDDAVNNNLMLGGNVPGKIIITGPNGAGKSTILKTIGIAAVLAQSWCIVPAKKADQSLFSSIRTSLATGESLSKKLSTGMAEVKIMAELLDDIRDTDAHKYILVLIDEPYKGMVEAESANRIYKFGKDVASFPQALIAIATHVKKPMFLEKDTNGVFGNYQVKIEEIKHGVFKRLFKLEQGPAMWWFEDEAKRGRFVDWLATSAISQE